MVTIACCLVVGLGLGLGLGLDLVQCWKQEYRNADEPSKNWCQSGSKLSTGTGRPLALRESGVSAPEKF